MLKDFSFLSLVLGILTVGSIAREELATLFDEQKILELGSKSSILIDPKANLNIHEISSDKYSNKFLSHTEKIPNLGLTQSAVWVRVRIKNLTFSESWILQAANPDMDNVEVYINDGLNWKVMELGQELPFSSRRIVNRNLLFNLHLPFGQEKTFYLRYKNESGMTIPIRLFAHQQYQIFALGEQLLFGIFFGFMLVLALYNLILYIKVRESGYLFYFMYITGYGLFQFSLYGLAYQYLWPKWGWWANHNVPFFIAIAFFCRILFTMSILNSKAHSLKLHRALLGLLVATVLYTLYFAMDIAGVVPTAIALGTKASLFVAVLYFVAFSVIISLLNFLCLKKKLRAAKSFMVAWVFMVTGLMLFTLKELGILPSNFITENAIPLGTVGEMCLLFISLGESIKAIKSEAKEKHLRQQAAIQAFQQEQLHAMRLEMELLKANIHPHFMLNSLNAATMWLQEDPSTAQKLLFALSEELKQLLKIASEKLISIEKEVQICEKHLEVMSLRHDKSFTLILKDIILEEKIPPMIFHTLVENGITHGYGKKENGEFILSRIEYEDKIQFILFNDGETSENKLESNGLGLKYVRARLQEAFAHNWQLNSQEVEGGWQVEITIKKSSKNGIVNDANSQLNDMSTISTS